MGVVASLRSGLERLLVVICSLLLAGLFLLVTVAVILRKLGEPLGWYDEIAGIMLAWLTFYGAAYAALRRSHLGVPNLVANLAPLVRVGVLLFAEILTIGFFVVVAYFGWQVINLLYGTGLASVPWLSVSYTQSVIPIGATLFVIAQLLTLPERVREAAQGKEALDPERAAVEGQT